MSPDSSDAAVAELEQWMGAIEGEHFEFKQARGRFAADELARYCCASANEGGGRVVLGVTNARPRRVVGTRAFDQPERVRRWLMEKLPLRIGVQVIAHPDGRVLVFEVPARPIGIAIQTDGIYWGRHGDSLEPLTPEELRTIFAEGPQDFSATACEGASLDDLDLEALAEFKSRWAAKAGNPALAGQPNEQVLRDTELLTDGGLAYAALILFGTRAALGRFLPQSEVVFEYRSSEASGPAQQRVEYRQGFLSFYDRVWELIGLRNDVQHYEEGLFVLDIPTFDERSVREALLNAISHRDYQLGGSVFVRQYARRLVVESPGGLPPGITPDNILDRQSPRNRRIADALAKCGLVERSGQGMNLMFENSISQGKALPDLAGTDAYYVVLTLHGEVQDPRFVRCLERMARETGANFDTGDFLVLDRAHREEAVPVMLRARIPRLVDLGALERVGRGRGVRYLLSRRFYTEIGERGAYTRHRGLDREASKALLLQHLRANAADGSAMSELQQVLPGQSRAQLKRLLDELRTEGLVRLQGERRWARWQAATPPAGDSDERA
jgi:ATP-dependent DNA helicase RecG